MLRHLMIGSLILVLSVDVAVSGATAVDYIDPCASYAGYQDADLAFLAGGGPDVDTALLDLDGDGYPCEALIGAPFEAVDAEDGVYPRGGNAAAGLRLPRPDEQLNNTPVDVPSPSAPPDDDPVLTGVLAPDAISVAASTLVDEANAGTFTFFGDAGADVGMGLDGYTPLAGLTLTVRDQATGAVIDRGTSDASGLVLLDGQTGAPFSLEIDGASSLSQPYRLADGQRTGLWLASDIAAPASPVAEVPPAVEAPPVIDVPQPVTVTLDPPVAVAGPQSASVDFSPVGGTVLILPTAGTGPADGSGAVPALATIVALLAAGAAAAVAQAVRSRPGSPEPTAVRADRAIRPPGR